MFRNRHGFTLVELLVAICIIGILIAMLLPALGRARDQANNVHCQSTLRQLYFAQVAYGEANRGRFTSVESTGPEDKWQRRLERYLPQGKEQRLRLMFCPSISDPNQPNLETSYGVNSCVMMANWSARRDAKMDSSRIILMGDKAINEEDWLTTSDGFWLVKPDWADMRWWIRSVGHTSQSTFRHGGSRYANVVMADGHTESLTPHDYRRNSGRWYWGTSPQQEYAVNFGTCCN
ncbi:MAG: type II secretion system protein [Burkholderiales bacterium]|nr:type II secretion system protein [Phycisphaerae bacterium]